jgi:HK97 family phage prohead protease
MEIKYCPSAVKKIDGRTVTGIYSTFGVKDAYNDIVHPGAYLKTLKENMRRIKFLWMHNPFEPPTAAIKSAQEVGKDGLPERILKDFPDATGGLEVTREYLDTPRGNEILTGIKADAITEGSIGYDPIKSDEEINEGQTIRNLREIKLWDISDVTWGANAATVTAKFREYGLVEPKAAIGYRDTGTADEGQKWSAPGLGDFTDKTWEELSDADKTRIANHYVWSSEMPPDNFGSLKLPHHMAGTSGIGKAVWAGVSAAMGALLGARGGVDIPEGERKAVYNHLAKHYDQFGKDVPDFKLVELCTLTRKVGILKAEGMDKVINARNIEHLNKALEELEEVLKSAEPSSVDDAKTLTDLEMRIAIAQRDISLIG